MRAMGDPDYVYRPWSPERRARASAAALARAGKAAKSGPTVGRLSNRERREQRVAAGRGAFDVPAAARFLGGMQDEIAALSEAEAIEVFLSLRDPVACPDCGGVVLGAVARNLTDRRCRNCKARFSIREGTIFYRAKMSTRQLLLALSTFGVGQNGAMSRGMLAELLGCGTQAAGELMRVLIIAGGSEPESR